MLSIGLDAPVGWNGNQSGDLVWPAHYVDVNPIGTKYSLGIHTGADLNDNITFGWDSDKFGDVYAMDNGIVTYAGIISKASTWGQVLNIQYDVAGFGPIIARYAHLKEIDVKVGQTVEKGRKVGRIGNGNPSRPLPYHLHFDISVTRILVNQPGHWPKNDFLTIVRNYVEPKSFIRLSRPGRVWPDRKRGHATSPVNFRTGPSTAFASYKTLVKGERLTILNSLDNWHFLLLDGGEYGWSHTNYVAEGEPF